MTLLNEEQRDLKHPPAPASNRVLAILDPLTAYGLTLGGACLILVSVDPDQLSVPGQFLAHDLSGRAAVSLAAGPAQYRGKLFFLSTKT